MFKTRYTVAGFLFYGYSVLRYVAAANKIGGVTS